MFNYRSFKITQGGGGEAVGGALLIQASNALIHMVPAYLKVLFPKLCFGFVGCRSFLFRVTWKYLLLVKNWFRYFGTKLLKHLIWLNAPNPRTKITRSETSLWDKGAGDKVLQKKYSHKSSLQTNPIQVRVLRLKERSILSRDGAILPQPSPGVVIPAREVLIAYLS